MAHVDQLSIAQAAVPSEDLAVGAVALARRFAAHATMWCVSVPWPSHGRHVAVEFVHPVIVGKRALPAMHVEGTDVAGALRLLARPGDVILAISSDRDEETEDLLLRAEAWGLTRFWLGAGSRPTPSSVEHVIWMDGVDAAVAARSGDIVILYHLLWELTHVVFEHPGLLEHSPACADEVCITCSDEGVIAEVVAPQEDGRADVIARGRRETIDASLVASVGPGDLVLVHAGVALSTVQGGRR